MSNRTGASNLENCFCIGCGYPLRELASDRCPECGRTFDPDDPRTMSLSRPLRKWQRWLLQPLSWQTISLALLGTPGLMYLSRWPHLTPVPWSVLASEFSWSARYLRPFTLPDYVFYASVGLWSLFLVLWGLRRLARLLVPRTARRANVVGADPRGRRRAVAVAAVLTLVCFIFGWQGRVGRRWIARAMRPLPSAPYGPFSRYDPWRRSPVALTPEQAQAALAHLAIDLPTSDERRAALFQLVELIGRPALPTIINAQSREKDEGLLVWELRLIGLCRDPSTAPLLIARLDDPRPAVRAAAADAIGILRQPSYPVTVHGGFWVVDPLSLDTQPPVEIGSVVSAPLPPNAYSFSGTSGQEHDLLDDPPNPLPATVRDGLQKMMTDGTTVEEREAAARALVNWPPDGFRLRVAEWGVWINNKGNLSLARTVIDEIPPFVHGTGNPISSLGTYFLYPSEVAKPVIHLTSNTPLAVDLEVQISEGRPWFAYPLPDDFAIGESSGRISRPIGWIGMSVQPGSTNASPDDYAKPAVPSLSNPREGYPWLIPHHRIHSSGWQGDVGIYSLGIHWQSLIVSPQQRSWMKPPVVPDDPKYQWWNTLRDVPSDWIGQRGEAERFLYYDGPTRAPVPIDVTLAPDGASLHFTRPPSKMVSPGKDKYPLHPFQPMAPTPRPDLPAHEGLYIDVRSGMASGQHVVVNDQPTSALDANLPLQGDAVVARFRKMLTDYGLTGPGADGLVRVWSPQLFHTEGRRFILRLSPEEYATQCPIQVKPVPTEMVRLGLVLSEFDPKPAPAQNSSPAQ